jgi:hypothetical protein
LQNPADIEAAHILFVPRRTIECDELIIEAKDRIEEHIKPRKWLVEDRIQNFALDLLMLEEDLLSLELPDDFRHFMLADDDTYQVYVANSINRLETVFGSIREKYAKGNIASNILERLKLSESNRVNPEASAGGGFDAELDGLILLDRSIDLISPFCIQ